MRVFRPALSRPEGLHYVGRGIEIDGGRQIRQQVWIGAVDREHREKGADAAREAARCADHRELMKAAGELPRWVRVERDPRRLPEADIFDVSLADPRADAHHR